MKTIQSAALVLALTFGTATVASAGTSSGSVNGTNTVDNIFSMKQEGTVVTLTVTASGSGNNKLKVKVEQRKSNGNWKTLGGMTVNPGSTGTMTYTVEDEFNSSEEMIRYHLGRKIGTKAISYTLTD